MEVKIPCHCNDSSGTDCPWCQGTGWKNRDGHAPGSGTSIIPNKTKESPLNRIKPKEEEKLYNWEPEKVDRKQYHPDGEKLNDRIYEMKNNKFSDEQIKQLGHDLDAYLKRMHERIAKATSAKEGNRFKKDFEDAKWLKMHFLSLK